MEEALTKWLTGWTTRVQDNQAYLSELDTPIGDADHGGNMARGAVAIEEALAKLPAEADSMATLKAVAMALISKVGGASGPLYGTAFLEMAKAAKTTTDVNEWLDAALAGILKRGGATVGDKTMVDAWTPLVAAYHAGKLDQQAIDDAVQATAPLVAHKGRASYLGERSVGHIDPGAMSSGYLFSALLEAGL